MTSTFRLEVCIPLDWLLIHSMTLSGRFCSRLVEIKLRLIATHHFEKRVDYFHLDFFAAAKDIEYSHYSFLHSKKVYAVEYTRIYCRKGCWQSIRTPFPARSAEEIHDIRHTTYYIQTIGLFILVTLMLSWENVI